MDFKLLELSLASLGRCLHVVGSQRSCRRLYNDKLFCSRVDISHAGGNSSGFVACEQLVGADSTLGRGVCSTDIESEPGTVRGRINPRF